MSENKRNLTEKEEYYKLITDEKSNHIETNANGAGSQCVRRKNIGSLSFRERYLSLRNLKGTDVTMSVPFSLWMLGRITNFIPDFLPNLTSRRCIITLIAIIQLVF